MSLVIPGAISRAATVILDLSEYRASCEDYERNWRRLDEVLYRVCQEEGDHTDRGVVNARVGSVGRVYATGIERQIPSAEQKGSALGILAAHLESHHTDVDGLIADVQALGEPHTPETLEVAVSRHGQLARIIAQISRRKMLPHSFASKYLHFHAPAVPIYDSVVRNEIERRTGRWRRSYERFPLPADCDAAYHRFALRFFVLYEGIREAGEHVTTKLLDHYLVHKQLEID